MTFEIKCKVCGSLNCVVEPLIDYDWYETPLEDGLLSVVKNATTKKEFKLQILRWLGEIVNAISMKLVYEREFEF